MLPGAKNYLLDCLESIIDPATGAPAYSVFHRKMSSKGCSLPQKRVRIYIVGVSRRKHGRACGNPEFRWPDEQEPRRLVEFLDRDGRL